MMAGRIRSGASGENKLRRSIPATAATAATVGAELVDAPAPLPLRRAMPPGKAFPLDALGNVLGAAARAIVDKVQCPDAIAGQSVLGAAALAVQAHADVVLATTGHAVPLSLFLVTVAASGERKSAADGEALWPIRKREVALADACQLKLPEYENARASYDKARENALRKAKGDFHAGKAALDAIGPAPTAPLSPMLTVPEPTLEGLHKLFTVGEPSLGLFSDEAGGFIGGHGMSDDNRLRMATGLSELWGGSPIRRVRSGDGATLMPGRRLSAHLMVQPGIADGLLADPTLSQQGLLSRLLVAAPASLAGTRLQRAVQPSSDAALKAYGARLLNILERPQPRPEAERNELKPREMPLSPEAARMARDFADSVETRIGPGGPLEPVKGFANKLTEHAMRISAVLQLVDNLDAEAVGADAMERGLELARFYASEALRLFDAGSISIPVRRAEALLEWLHKSWTRPAIGLRRIYQHGPNAFRQARCAREAVGVLVDHRWLTAIEGGAVIENERCREAWAIHPPAFISDVAAVAAVAGGNVRY